MPRQLYRLWKKDDLNARCVELPPKGKAKLDLNMNWLFWNFFLCALWSGNEHVFMDQYSLVAQIYIATLISFPVENTKLSREKRWKWWKMECLQEKNKRKLRRPARQKKPIGETLHPNNSENLQIFLGKVESISINVCHHANTTIYESNLGRQQIG